MLNGCEFTIYPTKSKQTANIQLPSTKEPTKSSHHQPKNKHQVYLLQTFAQARHGKVLGCEFTVNKDNFTAVKAKYGKPDTKGEKSPYYIYLEEHLTFGIAKNGLIFDIRSYDPKLRKITRSEVVKTLGIPDKIRHNKDESIYVYHVSRFEFKLIFELTKDDPTIDHSSVVLLSNENKLK